MTVQWRDSRAEGFIDLFSEIAMWLDAVSVRGHNGEAQCAFLNHGNADSAHLTEPKTSLDIKLMCTRGWFCKGRKNDEEILVFLENADERHGNQAPLRPGRQGSLSLSIFPSGAEAEDGASEPFLVAADLALLHCQYSFPAVPA